MLARAWRGMFGKCAFIILSFLFFATASAQADAICNGRYRAAGEMLDAAYGKYQTLYSGGLHWRAHDNVGATIDLYRLWRGLPDLQFRTVRRYQFGIGKEDPFHYYGEWRQKDNWAQAALEHSLPLILGADQTELTKRQKYITAVSADLATAQGPSPDWWLQGGQQTELTAGLQKTREMAQSEPFVDWLQTTLAASDAPWAIVWYLGQDWQDQNSADQYPVYRNLYNHALARYKAGEGIEWAVAAAHFMGGATHSQTDISDLMTLWKDTILSCTATPSQYAAYAVMRFEWMRRYGNTTNQSDRDLLPQSMRKVIAQNIAMRGILNSYRGRNVPGIPTEAITLVDDLQFLAWLNIARTYTSDSIEELISVHENALLAPKTIRALNVLSVDDLIRFARSDWRLPEDRQNILTTAVARLVALGRFEDAKQLVPDLGEIYPDHAEKIQRIMSMNAPLDVRLSLLVLQIPDASVWLTDGARSFAYDNAIRLRNRSKRGIDLPLEFRAASFLQRDLETWLQLPQRWRSTGLQKFSRAYRRQRPFTSFPQPPRHLRIPKIMPEGPQYSTFGFPNLIAWDEISQLGPHNGLSRRISLTLINWADNGTRNWLKRWFAPNDEMAAALRRIVYLNRSNDMGTYNGKPIGKIAFELLHSRFPETEAAQTTRYWYPCTRYCQR